MAWKKKSITRHVPQCNVCQRVKIECQRPVGELQPLEILEWKWEHILMDFVLGLPRSPQGNDIIWVIVDRLTKSTHFLPTKLGKPINKLAQQYLNEIVRLHRVLVSIVSDHDPRFMSKFWEGL